MAHVVYDPDLNRLVIVGAAGGSGLPKLLDPKNGTDYGKPVRETTFVNAAITPDYVRLVPDKKVK